MNEHIVFNLEKFKTVVHYLIAKCGLKDNVWRTVLYKLLYFSDFNFYELYEKALTGEKYIKKLTKNLKSITTPFLISAINNHQNSIKIAKSNKLLPICLLDLLTSTTS